MQHPRLGPRPLPLHLSTALMTWASSESAWQLWKRGLAALESKLDRP